MNLGLEGKACVVTGASRGIGRDVAERLCAEGASVLLVARGLEDLAEAAEAAGAAGDGHVHTLALDVTAPDAAERIVSGASERLGQVDVLVNNAGQAEWRALGEVPDEDWQAAWEA